jgi:hypothetical protein
MVFGRAVVSGILLLSGVSHASAQEGDDPLARYRGSARVILAFAPAPDDQRLVEQRRQFEAMGQGARERDLVLVEVLAGAAGADALRHRFGLPSGIFRVVLVGKDGTAKLGSQVPLGAAQLYPVIDAMPMRQEETSRAPRG